MAKRKREKKAVDKDSCEMNGHCTCRWFSVKITAMAFILFLITLWGWLRVKLLNVHWGWYLGITIVFGIIAMRKNCWCCKK